MRPPNDSFSNTSLADTQNAPGTPRSARSRAAINIGFQAVCIATATLSVLALGWLLWSVVSEGTKHLDWKFLRSMPSRIDPANAGVFPALMGTIGVCTICALTALPLGVGTAIFLEEFKPKGSVLRKLHGFVDINIRNLAGVPSIVYGVLGLSVFVTSFGLSPKNPEWSIGASYSDVIYNSEFEPFSIPIANADTPATKVVDGLAMRNDAGEEVQIALASYDTYEWPEDGEVPTHVVFQEDLIPDDDTGEPLAQRTAHKSWWYLQYPFGQSILAAGLTLMLVVLPIVIISSQEALRAVPDSLRQGALATGATQWQMVRRMTLPAAMPGILTGAILAMSRAIGEAAPLLVISGIVFINYLPDNLMSQFTVLPLQIFNWASESETEFHKVASSAILVLLIALLSFNTVAVVLRTKLQKPLQ